MSFDPFGGGNGGSGMSRLQQEIVEVYDRNPDMDAKAIARRCDCSASYVRETIKGYRGGFGGGGLF